MDFRTIPLARLAGMVRSKEVSSRELVEHALQVVERAQELNAWAALDADAALRAADAIDNSVAAGEPTRPLAGIPIGVKDMEDAVGFTTAYGSLLHDADPPASTDSVLVSRLRAAGCVVLGKTTTPEHGWTGDTVSPRTGATYNPWDTTRSPGGSSGGTAAAIASGMIPLGTGSDGGGSIRLPASICGLTGHKPSQGRIPLGGPRPPGAGVLAVRGPMALRARDIAYAMSTCVGPDASDPFSLPEARLDWHIPDAIDLPARVVWAPTPVRTYPIDAGVAAACDAAVRRLEAAGTEVIVVERLVEGNPLADWYVLWTALRDRAQGHLRGTPDWDRIDPGLRWDMDFAHEHVDATAVLRALDAIHLHNRDIAAALERAPIILTPTVASETALSGRLGTIDGVETAQWAPFTQLFNMTRHPAGTVPAGKTRAGLPIGIQVVGPQHADVAVLRALAALEDLWVDRSMDAFPSW